MTISRIGAASANATTLTLPTHAQWDLIVMAVARNASATLPTIPAGWTVHAGIAGGVAVMAVCTKTASSAAETSGTWTNADHLSCAVYRSDTNLLVHGFASIVTSTAAGSGDNITYREIAVPSPVTNKWLVAAAMHRNNDTDIQVAPTGMTAVASANTVGASNGELTLHDSNANYTSWPLTVYVLTAGTSSNYKTAVCEICESPVTIPAAASGGTIFNVIGAA